MSKAVKIPALVALVFAFFIFGPGVAFLLMDADAYVSKHGRVIDSDTGSGLPNAHVIASATFGAQSLGHGRAHGTLYRTLVTTDADGNYSIPSEWTRAVFWFPPIPGTQPEVKWRLSAIDVGYVSEGDDVVWQQYDKYGNPKYLPRSAGVKPDIGLSIRGFYIPDIKMKKSTLSAKQMADYYPNIALNGLELETQNDPIEVQLRSELMRPLAAEICSMDSNSVLDFSTMEGVGHLTSNLKKLFLLGKDFVPTPWPAEMYQHPFYPAGDVCQALKKTGDAS